MILMRFFLNFHVFFTFYAISKMTLLLFTVFPALPGDISGTIFEGDRRTLQAGCHATTAGV